MIKILRIPEKLRRIKEKQCFVSVNSEFERILFYFKLEQSVCNFDLTELTQSAYII